MIESESNVGSSFPDVLLPNSRFICEISCAEFEAKAEIDSYLRTYFPTVSKSRSVQRKKRRHICTFCAFEGHA